MDVRDLTQVLSYILEVAEGKCAPVARDLLSEQLQRHGSKRRGRLAMVWSRALGLRDDRAVQWAAACELLHIASLIHDDIQDRTPSRRGCPAAHVRLGADTALALGDWLLFLAFRCVRELAAPPPQRLALMDALSEAAERCAHGQLYEILTRKERVLSSAEWSELAGAKTGALFELTAIGPLVLAGGVHSVAQARAESALFTTMGVLFQGLDDLDDWGRGDSFPAREEVRVNLVAVRYAEEGGAELVHGFVEGHCSLSELRHAVRTSGMLRRVRYDIEARCDALDDSFRCRHGLSLVGETLQGGAYSKMAHQASAPASRS